VSAFQSGSNVILAQARMGSQYKTKKDKHLWPEEADFLNLTDLFLTDIFVQNKTGMSKVF
jgi:hypothetical protein